MQISTESMALLVQHYRRLRENDVGAGGKSAYRMTVRQLESMIRLSEARARIHCDEEVRPAYVEEAARLLKKSLIHVETEKIALNDVPAKPPQPSTPPPQLCLPQCVCVRVLLMVQGCCVDGQDSAMDVEPSAAAAAASKAKPATTAKKAAAGKAGQKKAQKPGAGGSAAVEDDASSAEEPLTVSYEDYRKISNTLVSRLRDYETSEEEDEESSGNVVWLSAFSSLSASLTCTSTTLAPQSCARM
jgi:hypothetical protein